jgi:hypothetical protein
MKVLIVTSFAGSWPYIPEMLEELERCGERAQVFDIDDLGRPGLMAMVAFRVPKLRYAARLLLLKKRLTLLPGDFDVVNIHFAAPIYRDLARSLRLRGKKLITSIWGSDFLRADPSALRALGDTLDASDIVTSNNPEVLQRLVARYPSISGRTRIIRWGLRSLDVIAALQESESQDETRNKLGVPLGKVVVTCGYNGSRAQRHATMIDALAALSPAVKCRLFALFPMTYPDDPVYRNEVKKSLESARVEYRIVDVKMSIEDICRIRVASDYAVNIQTTDSLSASIQEHMFAGSSMIVGNWLPYDVFEKIGVPLQKVATAEEISAALEKSTVEVTSVRSRPPYASRIYDYSSWSSNIGKWLELYSEPTSHRCDRIADTVVGLPTRDQT